ncbi:hypothetical protein [Streptomyces ziwulingensis]|uniref:hypothetical protein n=1 Tax=Streptomyces ziwulingensis TaxID=1045501 RepID=UPI0031EB6CE0
MTETSESRIRGCFCGCGENAEVDRWFAQGHEVTAAAALHAVQGLRLAHELVSLGYGPERSVVQTAVEEAGWARCPGCPHIGPAAHTCAADALAGDQSPVSPPALAESGPAQGRLLPAADDPTWEAVPLHLRQALRGPAKELVSPARGPLAARENHHLLRAVRAASRMQMTGAHWILLLTVSRNSLGSRRSQRAQQMYAVLEQVADRHAVRAGEPTRHS